jgi:hypothetical protein
MGKTIQDWQHSSILSNCLILARFSQSSAFADSRQEVVTSRANTIEGLKDWGMDNVLAAEIPHHCFPTRDALHSSKLSLGPIAWNLF